MNTLKTFVLLAALTALFGGLGYLLGGAQGMIVALMLAVVMNFVAWWNSDRVILAMYNAKPAASGRLTAIVGELAGASGLPAPATYVFESSQPNAFATGRNPSHAAIAVSSGLLELLNERELRAVLGHELTHIRNRDTLTMTVAATIAGAISSLSSFAFYFGAGRRNRRAGPLGALMLILFAPLAAALVQLAISRSREYDADKGGARICGDPMALAEALEKIDPDAHRIPNHIAFAHPATAHMFIVNPLFGSWFFDLFATHPPIHRRIEALRDMAINQSML